MHLTVIDSDEVRVAKGYRETRERAHADRERSLVEILRRGRADGSFPLADPEPDAVAISAVVSRVMANQSPDDARGPEAGPGLAAGLRAAAAPRRRTGDEFRASARSLPGKPP